MTNKAKKRERVTICPKCGSDNVSFEKNPIHVTTGLFHQFKQCNHCGHHAQLFPEVPISKVPRNPKNPAMIKDRQLVQASFGRGYLFYLETVIILLGIVGGLWWLFTAIR